MVGCLAFGQEVRQAGLPGHPENVDGAILVAIFGVRALGALRFEPGVVFLERVGDVLQKDQAEDDVLVFGGVHIGTQHVGGAPELALKADGGGVVLGHSVALSFERQDTACLTGTATAIG